METISQFMVNNVRPEQLELMGELFDYFNSCRNCNKRRCRYRISLPKKISKKAMREAYLNSLQLELFL